METKASPANLKTIAREIGELLSATRIKNDLSQESIAAETKIRIRYIRALEEGQTDAMPGIPYYVGFLRQYCRLLGIDSEPLVERFQAGSPKPKPIQTLDMPVQRAPTRQVAPSLQILFSVIVIGAVFTGGWQYWQYIRPPQPFTADIPIEDIFTSPSQNSNLEQANNDRAADSNAQPTVDFEPNTIAETTPSPNPDLSADLSLELAPETEPAADQPADQPAQTSDRPLNDQPAEQNQVSAIAATELPLGRQLGANPESRIKLQALENGLIEIRSLRQEQLFLGQVQAGDFYNVSNDSPQILTRGGEIVTILLDGRNIGNPGEMPWMLTPDILLDGQARAAAVKITDNW